MITIFPYSEKLIKSENSTSFIFLFSSFFLLLSFFLSDSIMSQRNPLYTNPKPCQHLTDYKLKKNGYKAIQKLLVTSPIGKTTVRKPNSEIPRCNFCNGYGKRLYFCLVCSSISCLEHTLLHPQSENGHSIFVDIERAELYCGVCSDQLYDPDFDQIVMLKHSLVTENESIGQRLVKRRKTVSGIGIETKDSQISGLDSQISRLSIETNDLRGLRGLNNLGSTCFMNSVLQALLHAPTFRDYFLNGGHSLEDCERRIKNELCLVCDVNAVFSAMYSGDRNPYSPAQLLYSCWQHSANLASYNQQDAHEFFISMLDAIHECIHENEGKPRSRSRGNEDCQCIAHRVFYGLLRSDVTCMTCGSTSTTYDPCVDISLNLDSNVASTESKQNEDDSTSTLLRCLDLFTRPEKLGSDQKLYCRNCKEMQNSSKQMSIKKLPLVLSFHVKRFEHSFVKKLSRKIDRYVHFPFSLDMTPYISSSILRARYGNRIFAFGGDESDIVTKFEIFAVVTHSGTLDSGHYVSFVRLKNQWYRCDDAWITEVDEETVRASQCYMVFYVQNTLDNKANEDLTHLPK